MQDYITANKLAYDQVAEEYLKRAGNSAEPLDELAGRPLRHAREAFKTGLTALEIGPGSGEVCAYLEDHNCSTTAMDVSPKILENVTIISPKTRLIEADILSYELEPAKFELIYCGALIHLFTLTDAAKVMYKVSRALKPGGILFINTTIHDTSSEGYYEKHDYDQKVKRYRHRYTRGEFEALITDSGLEIIDRLTTDEDSRGKYWLACICRKP